MLLHDLRRLLLDFFFHVILAAVVYHEVLLALLRGSGGRLLIGFVSCLLLVDIGRVHELHLVETHVAVKVLVILVVGQAQDVEVLILHLVVMLLLLADELVEPLLIHVGNELCENLRVIGRHVLKELGELIYWDSNDVTHFIRDFNELDGLWTIHVALWASIVVRKSTFHSSPIRIVVQVIHHTLHVFLVIYWATERIQVGTSWQRPLR